MRVFASLAAAVGLPLGLCFASVLALGCAHPNRVQSSHDAFRGEHVVTLDRAGWTFGGFTTAAVLVRGVRGADHVTIAFTSSRTSLSPTTPFRGCTIDAIADAVPVVLSDVRYSVVSVADGTDGLQGRLSLADLGRMANASYSAFRICDEVLELDPDQHRAFREVAAAMIPSVPEPGR